MMTSLQENDAEQDTSHSELKQKIQYVGRLEVKKVVGIAITGYKDAVRELFSGFLSDNEKILGCGYLGSSGFIIKEYSFWCVTNLRACSLRIKRGGEVIFSSGYLESINAEVFYQPSLLMLWQ